MEHKSGIFLYPTLQTHPYCNRPAGKNLYSMCINKKAWKNVRKEDLIVLLETFDPGTHKYLGSFYKNDQLQSFIIYTIVDDVKLCFCCVIPYGEKTTRAYYWINGINVGYVSLSSDKKHDAYKIEQKIDEAYQQLFSQVPFEIE